MPGRLLPQRPALSLFLEQCMKRILLPLLALCAGVLLGVLVLLTPKPAPAEAQAFSALRVQEDILRIAVEPHTAWDQDAMEPVRQTIKKRLSELGLEAISYRHPPVTDAFGHSYPLENIGALIPGTSGRNILLMAHYDSAPKKRSGEQAGSLGAADDGYGVATMLELAGILMRRKAGLVNGVRFLFTDAEETGLQGSTAEVERNFEAWADVDFVINIEARGVKGPAVMFETGRDNRATIELFRKARWPFGYSFAVDVYRNMPNKTDFTPFINKGLPGLNFSVLDDLSYYHTPRDNPGNISLSSIQHYGEQILPIVLAYTQDQRYSTAGAFSSKEDMVYFTWLPGVLISYPAGVADILSIVVAVLFGAWLFWMLRYGSARAGASLVWFVAWLGMAAITFGIGYGVSILLGKLSGIPWKMTYMPGVPFEKPVLWVLLACAVLIPWLIASVRSRKGKDNGSLLAGALALNLVVLAVVHRYLPGASFMFALPVLTCIVSDVLVRLSRKAWIGALPAALVIALFLPILHLFTLALTIGALGIVLLVAFLPLAMLGPLLARPETQKAG